jgi:ABC-type multidrug transport system ATPase subunit
MPNIPNEADGNSTAVSSLGDQSLGDSDGVSGDSGPASASESGPTNASEPGPTNTSDPVFTARGIEKTYSSQLPVVGRDVEVLTGADFELYPGEIVGIVGENGSGKSTLMQILVGALAPDAGTVDGDATVGWCPQETLLYDRLTVEETFELFGEAYGMSTERVRERRDELAARLDFEQFLEYRVDRLSGGNRQKVNLAVALLHEPDVVLLDEPYTGFDWETYLAFWELTEDLVADGTAIAIISHLISERERFDRVVELRDGQLHERAEPPQQARSAAHDSSSSSEEVAES